MDQHCSTVQLKDLLPPGTTGGRTDLRYSLLETPEGTTDQCLFCSSIYFMHISSIRNKVVACTSRCFGTTCCNIVHSNLCRFVPPSHCRRLHVVTNLFILCVTSFVFLEGQTPFSRTKQSQSIMPSRGQSYTRDILNGSACCPRFYTRFTAIRGQYYAILTLNIRISNIPRCFQQFNRYFFCQCCTHASYLQYCNIVRTNFFQWTVPPRQNGHQKLIMKCTILISLTQINYGTHTTHLR